MAKERDREEEAVATTKSKRSEDGDARRERHHHHHHRSSGGRWEENNNGARHSSSSRHHSRHKRDRSRERSRERSRHYEEEEEDEEREGKRRRKDSEGSRRRESDRRRREDSWDGDEEDGRKRRDSENDRKKRESSVGRKRESSVGESGRRKKESSVVDAKMEDVDPEEEKQRIKEAEDKKLQDEIEKRRRRVQEWQEFRKRTEIQVEVAEGKEWTLDNDNDADEETKKEADGENAENDEEMTDNAPAAVPAEEEVDPLDAFMVSILPEASAAIEESALPNGSRRPGDDESGSDGELDDDDDEEGEPEENDEDFLNRMKKSKAEKFAAIDHSKVNYPAFRKNFYIEVKEITRMSADEVEAYRKELEVKAKGADVPRPIKSWNQAGLHNKVLDGIKKAGFEKPLAIQAQALPIIMSGRDCIGIAKTGSGKTLAFVLPMLRHILNQDPLAQGDGPIALIMAPTRELVQQIHADVRKFTRVLGLTSVAVYGGSGVAQQISDLKRGAQIVVCTPGRMIDVLCTSSGKITNLRRVTYLVMDEADRMFDLGFEPQIMKIVHNIRPDCQTVLFSATFPRQVELLARNVLTKPVEVQVGGRNVVNKDISQTVEVRPESERFPRLLELLGQWSNKGKILVFVHSQDNCDSLFRDLLKCGYPCLSLHGGKEQSDRESTISDFKANVCNLLVATSVAARGLDVQDLELVVNFDVPNHYEDYVHRVGRTGRAGRKGTAVTFISPDEEKYAADLVKALERSEQTIPEDLKSMADAFKAKGGKGHGSGYGGRGHKFNAEEDEAQKAAKKAQAKEYGYEEDETENNAASTVVETGALDADSIIQKAKATLLSDAAARAAAVAASFNLQHSLAKIKAESGTPHFEDSLEINDLPQHARYQVTKRETLGRISEITGAAVTTRGQYIPPNRAPAPGERKLYLYIEADTETAVRGAKLEIKQILEESRANAPSYGASSAPGKYNVL